MAETPPFEEQALYKEIRRLWKRLPNLGGGMKFSPAFCRDLEAIRQLGLQLLALQQRRETTPGVLVPPTPRRRSTDVKEP